MLSAHIVCHIPSRGLLRLSWLRLPQGDQKNEGSGGEAGSGNMQGRRRERHLAENEEGVLNACRESTDMTEFSRQSVESRQKVDYERDCVFERHSLDVGYSQNCGYPSSVVYPVLVMAHSFVTFSSLSYSYCAKMVVLVTYHPVATTGATSMRLRFNVGYAF